MQIHLLKRRHPNKAKKPRVGRGGKRGTTSGRGTKGQKSRSGHRIRPALRDYIQRLPKLRGTSNRQRSLKVEVINVGDLTKYAESGIEVITAKTIGKTVKILGDGEIRRPVTVKGLAVSASAKGKIEAAGGKVL